MSDFVANCTLIVVILVCLSLIGTELAQAAIISLLFGIFYVLTDIYHELKRKK